MVAPILFQRPTRTTALVEPDAPMWAQRMVLKLQSFFMPMVPLSPIAVWQVNKADLPPAVDWPGCICLVRDQNCLVMASGSQWLKLATSGPV